MDSKENKIQTRTAYVGNTRRITKESLKNYCSKFGIIVECSNRLRSIDEIDLVDFMFIRFLNEESCRRFVKETNHVLDDGTMLDVRPFSDIIHTAVPLLVDRKISVRHISDDVSKSELKKYVRSFGNVKETIVDVDTYGRRSIYVEFESSSSVQKLLKSKGKSHRIGNQTVKIFPFLRPTDVDLHRVDDEENDEETSTNRWIELEKEYSLKIRDDFNRIEKKLNEYIKEQRENYFEIRSSTSFSKIAFRK